MKTKRMLRMSLLGATVSGLIGFGLIGCSSSPSYTTTPPPPVTTTTATYTINTGTSPTLGTYLVDGKGMTLYWTTADSPGVSNVPANLLSVWPVFYVANIAVPSSLNASDFGTITRTDGTKQTTYKNWPLYYYASDTAAGQTGGQGLGGKWSVVGTSASGPQPVPPPTTSTADTINVATSPTLGTYLVDGKGMALYWTTADSPGVSNVPANLLSVWPVFYVANIAVPSSLNASDFGTITRSDGTKQTTYKNWPLYYYASDTAAGQTGGQGLGGKWSVVGTSASGPQPVTPPTTSTAFTINVATSPTLGTYLVDGKGMALYWTTADSPGVSNVPANLLSVWPVFYVANIAVPSSLNASDFGTITRADGTKQTTYKNWPLYYYASDTAAGQTGGQGLGGKWSVAGTSASGPQPVPPTTTSADTFGTLAATGQTQFDSTCAVCHGSNGQGTSVCPVVMWGSGANLGSYNGATLFTDAQGMLSYMSKAMPLTAPGSLSTQQYTDLLAYILVQGGHVSSSTPFNESQLSSIAIN